MGGREGEPGWEGALGVGWCGGERGLTWSEVRDTTLTARVPLRAVKPGALAPAADGDATVRQRRGGEAAGALSRRTSHRRGSPTWARARARTRWRSSRTTF
eukprot:4729849-Pyramimonas_sp.AAC.1